MVDGSKRCFIPDITLIHEWKNRLQAATKEEKKYGSVREHAARKYKTTLSHVHQCAKTSEEKGKCVVYHQSAS